jgi:hypothetical protein
VPASRDGVDRIEVTLQALQVRAQVRCRLKPELSILLERLADNSLELGMDSGIQLAQQHRRLIEDEVHDRRDVRRAEGTPSSDHLVQHHAC